MGAALARSFDQGERRRLAGLAGGVGLLHVAGWGLLLAYGLGHPALLALGGLAYTFGLRHAFDADHISAIDNTTRKLLQEGRRPVAVGFFFSLGHSTVVLLIAGAIGLTVKWLIDGVVHDGGMLRSIGGTVGTLVSGGFLIAIGVMNLVILIDIVRMYRRMRSGRHDRDEVEHELATGGFMTRFFGRVFRVVEHSWQMYPVGFLFGLGFDTASEVALLAISAAGMSLMDSADGAFMAKAYSWAFTSPMRKIFYNLTMTSLSVAVALFVGGAEVAQVLIHALDLRDGVFGAIARFDVLGSAGYFIVAAFVMAWAVAFIFYKARRMDERWSEQVDKVA